MCLCLPYLCNYQNVQTQGDLGDLGDGEFSEEELQGGEEFDEENDNPWAGLEDGLDPSEEEEDAEPLNEDLERLVSPLFCLFVLLSSQGALLFPINLFFLGPYMVLMIMLHICTVTHNVHSVVQTNPKFWDDADAEDVEDAYGEDWEKVAAFTYDGVDYTMVKILEPVLVLAKEDPVSLVCDDMGELWRIPTRVLNRSSWFHHWASEPIFSFLHFCLDQNFKGITKWVLPSEEEAEEIAPLMEALIKVKLGIIDDDEESEED